MKNRRSFLATVATGSVGLSLAALEPATAEAPKPASSAAVAIAATMRARFDPSLTDAELQAIAEGIDANAGTAKALNPKKKRLKNSDAPIVRFAVAEGEP